MAVAALSFHSIEAPFIQLGKKITTVFDSQPHPKGSGLSISLLNSKAPKHQSTKGALQ
jgi:hypothetical protein